MATEPMIYAIDFGTSNSLLAAATPQGTIEAIPLDSTAEDATVLRSLMYFPNSQSCHYGADALKACVEDGMQGRLVRSVKRFLPVSSFIGTFIGERPIHLEELIGFFLLEMRRRGNEHFQRDVTRVVLGRPARFSANEADDRFAQFRLEKAARLAGFTEIEFCPEPLAAAFEFRRHQREERLVLVADFGGGTSDYTVIRLRPDGYDDSDVLAIGGYPLAGDAFDGSLMRHQIAPFFGADLHYRVPMGSNILKMPPYLIDKLCSPADLVLLDKSDTMEFFRLLKQWSLREADREKIDRLFCLVEDRLGFQIFEEIERLKRQLSAEHQAVFDFPYPTIEVRTEVSRADFEKGAARVVEPIFTSLDETLKVAQVNAADIDLVCVTGGTARVPILRDGLLARFGADKVQEHRNFHSVIHGLAERGLQMLQA